MIKEFSIEFSDFDINKLPILEIDKNGKLLTATEYDILFLPYNSWQGKEGIFISKDIFSLFEFLKAHHPEIESEVFVGADDYLELGLHGAFKNFGKVYIAPHILSVALGLFTNYAYDALKSNDKQEARITIETKLNETPVKIYFSGSPENLKKHVEDTLEELKKTDKKEWSKKFKKHKREK